MTYKIFYAIVLSLICSAAALGQPVQTPGVSDVRVEGTVSIVYDAPTGNFGLHSGDISLTTISVRSQAGVFSGAKPEILNGVFDLFTPNEFFYLNSNGFSNLDLGQVLPVNWPLADLANDFSIRGSLKGGGTISPVNVVPGTVDFPLDDMLVQEPLPWIGPQPRDGRPGNFQVADSLREGVVSLVYDPNTGNVGIDGGGATVGSLQIDSASSMFGGVFPEVFQDSLDELTHKKIYKITKNGFDRLNLGQILEPGLDPNFLAGDFYADGYLSPRGAINDYALVASTVDFDSLVHEQEDVFIEPTDVQPIAGFTTNVVNAALESSRVVVYYEEATGHVQIAVAGPDMATANSTFNALTLTSASGVFGGQALEGVLSGSSDRQSPGEVIKVTEAGMSELDLGLIALPGLTNSDFVNDVCVTGAWIDGADFHAEYQYPGAGSVPFTCNATSAASNEPADIQLDFDETSGDLTIEIDDGVARAAGDELTTIEIRSESGIFTGRRPDTLQESDVFTADKIIKQNRDGFQKVVFSSVVSDGLTEEFVASDISIDITTSNGNRIGAVTLNSIAIPEPSTGMLMLFASIAIGAIRRR